MSGKDLKKAEELTESDNKFLNMFKGKTDTTQKDIEKAMKKSDDYKQSTDDEIATAAERVLGKLRQVNSEYLSWFEIVLAMVFAIIGYNLPVWLLFFQKKMRKMEMENEVMQFQTIILMLMRIERVNVEMILEWLERYSNIFREPIAKCVNNYESGPWEALEEMKDDVNYKEFIRLIESMQAAVEKIPIAEAFDELDSERDYYQERRKESNARLIQKKGMIGKVIGFAPMVGLFVGYLIIPLVFIGLMSMMSSMNDMSSMAAQKGGRNTMENATKALEMAGSLLIGVLLLGCLLFAYTRMSELKDTEHKVEVSEQAKDFNQDYETYNRNNLYGSDLFSLANQIEDYNKKEADGKAYGRIEMKVTLKTEIINAKFFTDMTYDGDSLNQKYNNLAKAINKINKEYYGKAISYWANYGTGSRLESQLLQELRTNKI